MIRSRSLSRLLASIPLVLLHGFVRGEETPKGEVTKYVFDQSKIFPGTVRDYWVYVPRQYDPAKPACLYVNQDGIQYSAPAGLRRADPQEGDARHHRRLRHARQGQGPLAQALDRFNRSYEYDGLGDNYVRFLLEELLPRGGDGRPRPTAGRSTFRATATTGPSAGPAAARSAPSRRPGSVPTRSAASSARSAPMSACAEPTSIRPWSASPSPSRSASSSRTAANDLNIYGGDWWMANQEMERALRFAGYEVNHAWGTGGHEQQAGRPGLPRRDALALERLAGGGEGRAGVSAIERDPDPRRGAGRSSPRATSSPRAPRPTRSGEVFFNDIPASKTYKIGLDGKVSPFLSRDAAGPTARRSAPTAGFTPRPPEPARSSPTTPAGRPKVIAEGFRGNDLVVRHDGGLYVTEPSGDAREPSKVWYISPEGEKRVVDTGLKFANGVTLSPDQSLLYVAESRTHWVYSYQVQPDGSLAHKQKYLSPARPRHRRRQPAPTGCGSTATAGSTWRRGWAFRSATRPAASTASSRRRTARSPTSASAARSSTSSTPPAATRSSSAR